MNDFSVFIIAEGRCLSTSILIFLLFSYILLKEGMNKKSKIYFNLLFLSLFLSVTLFINFFHTERTIERNDNCPACQFQYSSLTTCQINFFCLPPLSFLSTLQPSASFNYTYFFSIDPASRSPPQI